MAHLVSNSPPMTNPEASPIDRIRAQLWMASLKQMTGLSSPEKVAKSLISRLDLKTDDYTSMKRYAGGKQRAGGALGPNASGKWVQLAAKVWPDTRAWFMTPLWFLLREEKVSFDDLLICVNNLPPLFREDFLLPSGPNSPAALCVNPIPKDFLYSFTDPVNPWSLGALACAMRRAELAGEPGTMRWAGVGIVWAIGYLLESTHPVMHPPLKELRELVSKYFSEIIYPGQYLMRAPITDADIDRFASERQKFVDYFLECDFGEWEPGQSLPWIHKEG